MSLSEKVKLIILWVLCIGNVFQFYWNGHLSNERDKAYFQVEDLSTKLSAQNDAVDQLINAQKIKEQLIKKTQEDAQKLRNEYDKAAKKILAQNVSKNCDQAVQWGASQGRVIYECWTGKC